MEIFGKRGRGRPKLMWAATVAKDLIVLELPIDLRTNRMQWRRKTHEVDPIFDGNKA